MARPLRELTKSLFLSGARCHKLLWWQAHERRAEELAPGLVLQERFAQGRHVEEVARQEFPGGELVEWPAWERELRLEASRNLIARRPPAIFQASFAADDLFVSVDVLELRSDGAWNVIEVKQNKSVKDEHLADVAIQLHVLRRAGVDTRGAFVMHLNPEHRHPGPTPLFLRSDVTEAIAPLMARISETVNAQRAVLRGSLPDVAVGLHCFEPRECPFFDRCWPMDPLHVRHLTGVGPKKTIEYLERGIERIPDLPADAKLSPQARRQIEATESGKLIVEDGLSAALEPFRTPLGYLDFETVAPAIPVWDGMAPHAAAAAQFSYHVEAADGTVRHVGFLADGPHDPRPEVAKRLVEATRGSEPIVMYTGFERTRLRDLAAAVPALADQLRAIQARLVDLHPVIRNYVYHPEFGGSFSIKHVVPALVPGLDYRDLEISEGLEASVLIARTMFVARLLPDAERERLRRDLEAYCRRDTEGLVELVNRLRDLAARRD